MEIIMTKNLKLSYILFFIFSGILIAWNTLSNFFGGTAINFVSLVGLCFTILLLIFKDKCLFSRIKDLFILACSFCVLELVVYFAFEFGTYNYNILKGFMIYQNIITFLGLLFFCYIAFRFIFEMKNKKLKFIEILLGNEKRSVKVKKAKEVSNGCLEEKPNKNSNTQPQEREEDVVIIETEE